MTVEETRRRNDASMARKRTAKNINPAAANAGSGGPESPMSPIGGNGAMDTLLEKLRAAAPQTRDQRDRRRRARLKEKHQDRIASGQQMPDMAELTKSDDADDSIENPVISPTTPSGEWEKEKASDDKDVADRAASLLLGLRGDGDGDGGEDTLRVRRRRESADVERKDRRSRRRLAASTSTGDVAPAEPSPIPEDLAGEEQEEGGSNRDSGNSEDKAKETMPTTMISPPTPERGSESRPLEIAD